MGGLVTQKKLDAVGERDEVAEARPEVEEKDGAQIDGKIGVEPSPTKEGSEGFPDPIENERDREKETGVKGQLEKSQEGFRHPEGDEVHFQIGLIEVTEQGLGELKEDEHQEDDNDPD